MSPPATALLVALGGAAGALARWALGGVVQARELHPHFPAHTFAVNLLGCFAIGLALGVFGDHKVLRPLLVIGFLGAFTTFSTFGFETLVLLREGRVLAAAAYVGLSAGLGVLLAAAGWKLAG